MVLLKQYLVTATAVLLVAIAVLALGALPVVALVVVSVQQHHKVVEQEELPLQMPPLFFLIKQARPLVHLSIQEPEAVESLDRLEMQGFEEVKAAAAAVLVEA